jgi:uncharacterized protein
VPERDGYIPGVPCWVDTNQSDPEAAVDFYRGLFGWKLEDVTPPESDGKYFIARHETPTSSIFETSGELQSGDVAAIGSVSGAAPPNGIWNTYFWVDSADETASKVRDAGGGVMVEPFDFMDASRTAVLADPEGAVFRVWEAKRHKGAGLVNDPGSLNFNSLSTRDIEGAKSFYGPLFGWQTLDMGGGVEMWTLAGYGEHLEGYHPGLRKQVVEAGAPEGFADVVAQINPIADDEPDTPANWSVTFATDDADATAAKATELGGKVIVPPFDAPWVRMTIIGDPQGAIFIASKFAPENRDLAPPG